MSTSENSFDWDGTPVNLKLARTVVRYLANQHGRLTEVGPTQVMRDILNWFQHCNLDEDETFRALEQKHGKNDDFDDVVRFLKAFDYDTMKKQYRKQSGSLWMAVRGVLRRKNQDAPVEQATSRTSASEESGAATGPTYEPSKSIQMIREGADEIAFEMLMLLSNPQNMGLTRQNREELEHAERTLLTAVDDLRVILRHFGNDQDDDVQMKVEDPFDDDYNNGGHSPRGSGSTDYSSPGSPDSTDSDGRPFGSGSSNGSYSSYGSYGHNHGSSSPPQDSAAATNGGHSNFTWVHSLSAKMADVKIDVQKGSRMSVGKRTAKSANKELDEESPSGSKRVSIRVTSNAKRLSKRIGQEAAKRLSLGKSSSKSSVNEKLSEQQQQLGKVLEVTNPSATATSAS